MNRFRLTPIRAAFLSGLYVALWCGLSITLPDVGVVDSIGWGVAYLFGLAWLVYAVEGVARRIEVKQSEVEGLSRPLISVGGEVPESRWGGWNPFDPAARYFGFLPSFVCCAILAGLAVAAFVVAAFVPEQVAHLLDLGGRWLAVLSLVALATAMAQSQRFRQSVAVLAAYSLLFVLVYFLAHLRFGAADEVNAFELPAGGGSDSIKASSMKVKKVATKKYARNPNSVPVYATPPPLEKIDVQLTEETANRYQAGQGAGGLGEGEGDGGGFGGGTGKGKWRFIRLRHSDKHWDRNFGIGHDRNLLAELLSREPTMQGKVADETEAINCVTLGNFPEKKCPPLIYVGGTQTFNPSAADKRILRQYLIERHGMILGDNLGGGGFHNSFLATMNEITGTTSVTIDRDDPIHKRPYSLPQLPIVVAHGGTVARGWKIDGRWAVYYHPGALSDAWTDHHAGIKKAIWEQCFQLGINILYYAYREYNKWLLSQRP